MAGDDRSHPTIPPSLMLSTGNDLKPNQNEQCADC